MRYIVRATGYRYHTDINGWLNMIRYHSGSGKYITYSMSTMPGLKIHFAQTDIHNNMVDAYVANGYNVEDFEIIGDYVFFCGWNISSSGFLGWFNINGVFNNSGNVARAYIDETLSDYGIEQLTDIVVYYDKLNRIHIAGVGQHIVSGTTTYKAFEAVGYTPNNMQYRVADLTGWEPTPKLTVTDDFVLYATPIRNIYSVGLGYILEPFPKNDMFALPTHPTYLFQTVVAGSSLPPTALEPYSPFDITHKYNNTIAICNYRANILIPTVGDFDFVLREYDLSPLLTSSPIQMTTDSRVKLSFGVGEIKKLAYDTLTKHYITLCNYEVASGTYQDAVITMDYSSGSAPSTALATFPHLNSYEYLFDMCLNGSSIYTASGFPTTYYNYLFWQDDVLTNAYSCADYMTYSVDPKDPEVDKEEYYPLDVVGWIALNFLPNIEVDLLYKDSELDCN